MKNWKTWHKVLAVVLVIAIIGLIYYFVKRSGAIGNDCPPMTQSQAVEMSKQISNYYETEDPDKIAAADDLVKQMACAGWMYVDYGQVTKKIV